jgi:predicted RNase H-like HicB family nuclease
MGIFNVLVERDLETGLLIGSVPGWPGAHSQAVTWDELEGRMSGSL